MPLNGVRRIQSFNGAGQDGIIGQHVMSQKDAGGSFQNVDVYRTMPNRQGLQAMMQPSAQTVQMINPSYQHTLLSPSNISNRSGSPSKNVAFQDDQTPSSLKQPQRFLNSSATFEPQMQMMQVATQPVLVNPLSSDGQPTYQPMLIATHSNDSLVP